MSLKPQAISPVPEETAGIAHAAYPKGNVYTLPTMLRKIDAGAKRPGTRADAKDHGHIGSSNLDPVLATWVIRSEKAAII